MRRTFVLGVATALVAVGFVALFGQNTTEAGKKGGMMVSHDVYFSLTDNSPKAQQVLVDLCKKHLSKHPGEVFFAVGPLADDLKREVNDRDFDVALHKSLRLTESRSIELRLEAFNVFNRGQFYGAAAVNGNISSSNFGQVVNAGAPRLVQIAAKFHF